MDCREPHPGAMDIAQTLTAIAGKDPASANQNFFEQFFSRFENEHYSKRSAEEETMIWKILSDITKASDEFSVSESNRKSRRK